MTTKTLKLTVYLWTDELPEGADCWDYGQIYLPSEKRKDAGSGTMFNDPAKLGEAMLEELRKAGIVVAKKE